MKSQRQMAMACLFSVVLSAMLGGLLTTPAEAKPPTQNVKYADYIIDSLGSALGGVRKLTERTKYGYDGSDACLGVALIRPGSSYRFNRRLDAGRDYLFVGYGDKDAMDVDIVISRDGRTYAKDEKPDKTPVVQFTPQTTAVYTIQVDLARAKDPSFCSFAVLKSGGFDVPVVNATAVATRFLEMCNNTAKVAARQGLTTELFARPNQGAIWGTLLRGGESITISNLNIGNSDCVVVAAGDRQVKDIDLYLKNGQGDVVAKDEKPDAIPFVRHRTAGGRYSVKLSNAAKASDATLCLMGVLSLR